LYKILKVLKITVLQEVEEEETLSKSFYEAGITLMSKSDKISQLSYKPISCEYRGKNLNSMLPN
jgi:hypothetical protein